MPIDAFLALAVAYPLACSYGSRSEGLVPAQHCAAVAPGGLAIAPGVQAKLTYDHGLASIAVAGHGWYYRRRDGRAVLMVTFDQGPDYFRGGLARAMIGERLGYVDRRLRVRLRTRYDWGGPFAHGRAVVCIGCAEVKVDGGEHSVMSGGRWGAIDRVGREVVSLRWR